jgi:spore maturation protein CgeB
MRIALFYHSLQSCWNNGHAHFLRGYATSLMERGHEVSVFEPAGNWSATNLRKDAGPAGFESFNRKYPNLQGRPYHAPDLDLERMLDGVDLVVAHEWNDPELIRALGEHRRKGRHLLLFHDTHHRAATAPAEMSKFELSAFDGALVYGEVLREIYLKRGWAKQAWVWHEAADPRVFRPLQGEEAEGDLVWVGNWGDEERSAELQEFLIGPARALGLKAAIYGVRYPANALAALQRAAIEYRGWLANASAPEVFARYKATVHVPRRPYVEALPGIPTIRVFEALACGIPLVCSPWNDAEGLFTPGRDFLMARNGAEMTEMLRHLIANPREARAQAEHGRQTVLRRHTTDHRADELIEICRRLGAGALEPQGRRAPADESASAEVTA